jgi:hypothetical protein
LHCSLFHYSFLFNWFVIMNAGDELPVGFLRWNVREKNHARGFSPAVWGKENSVEFLLPGREAYKTLPGFQALIELLSERCLKGSQLCCAVLCCAVLCCAVLCCAVLCCADCVSAALSYIKFPYDARVFTGFYQEVLHRHS